MANLHPADDYLRDTRLVEQEITMNTSTERQAIIREHLYNLFAGIRWWDPKEATKTILDMRTYDVLDEQEKKVLDAILDLNIYYNT